MNTTPTQPGGDLSAYLAEAAYNAVALFEQYEPIDEADAETGPRPHPIEDTSENLYALPGSH